MDKRAWERRALWLAAATIAYNLLEAAACGVFGARDESLALLGFGTDSLIEAASGVVVLWRFTREEVGGDGEHPAERRAQRAVGGLLLALAAALALGAGWSLWRGHAPEGGVAGTVISLVSLATMWLLLRAKRAAAAALDSKVLRADAFCTQSCMWLSGVLLAGSFLFSATHVAWFDAAASLGMAWLVGREGWENWRGDECGCGQHCQGE